MDDRLNAYQKRLRDLVRVYLRRPERFQNPDQADASVTDPPLDIAFEPPLTAGEQTTFARLRALARSAVAIEGDIAGLTIYQGLPSPTPAQTGLAVKAQSRILRALLRD